MSYSEFVPNSSVVFQAGEVTTPLRCQRCERSINAPELYVVLRWLSPPDGWKPNRTIRTTTVDLRCAIDIDPVRLRHFVGRSRLDAALRRVDPSLTNLLAKRLEQINQREKHRPQYGARPLVEGWSLTGQRNIESSAPTAEGAVQSPRSIACDDIGRPKVKILCCGMATNPDSAFGSALWNTLRGNTWSSTKRVYEFVPVTDPCQLPIEDPSQPVVGTLFAVVGSSNAKIEGLRGFALWGALKLPPPVLWVLGLRNAVALDPRIVNFRQLMQAFAIDGDAAPTLSATKIGPEELDNLVALFDEHCSDGNELCQRDDSSALCAEALLREHSARETELWHRSVINRIALSCRAYSPRTERAVHALFDRLMQSGDLDLAVEFLARGAIRDGDRIQLWIDRALTNENVDLQHLSLLCWCLRENCGRTVDAGPLVAALQRQSEVVLSSPRVLQLFEAILTHGNNEHFRTLAEWFASRGPDAGRLAERAVRASNRRYPPYRKSFTVTHPM